MVSLFEKLVCTGGSGRLGRHVVALLRDSCTPTVLDAVPLDGDDAYVRADITDVAALRRAFAGTRCVVVEDR